jgi:colanic acid/amylovoran biosynthesis glycosyltransferase
LEESKKYRNGHPRLMKSELMKLIYITTSFPFGKGEGFILPELQELNGRGYQVFVVPLFPRGQIIHEGAEQFLNWHLCQGILSWSIIFSAFGQMSIKPMASLRALFLILTFNPTHLLKNISVFLKGLWLASEAKKLGAEHIHVHWASTTASMAMIASEVSGIPWSFTAHRWDIKENNLLQRKVDRAKFARFIAKNGISMSQKRGIKYIEKMHVLHIGIDLPKVVELNKSQSLLVPNRHIFRLLCPANLVQVKGHQYLIEALTKLTDLSIELWFVGDGPLRSQLENSCALLGLHDYVKFFGALPRQQLLNFYQDGLIDVVVLPSIDLGNGIHEGIPVSLMEAMAYQIPVISTKTGGIPELVVAGTGVLVSDKDSDLLAYEIRHLYTSPELSSQLGRAGFQRVREQFEIGAVVDKLVELFEDNRIRK